MVDFAASDKLLLLSKIELDEKGADDEIFDKSAINHLQKANINQNDSITRNTSDLSIKRNFESSQTITSTKSNLYLDRSDQDPNLNDDYKFGSSDRGLSIEQATKSSHSNYNDKKCNPRSCCFFKVTLLMLNFLFNGVSFGLFMYSRDYFINTFRLDEVMSTNVILIDLASILVGIFIANFIVTKLNNRFHLLFICSIISSACLFGIVQTSPHFMHILVLISLFGICMGFSTTIGLKWCLSINVSEKSQNWMTNLLQVLGLAGMLVFFCFFNSGIGSNHYSGFNNHSVLNANHNHIFTTTPKIHLKKPEISDGSYLEQNHVTKPLKLASNSSMNVRSKREFKVKHDRLSSSSKSITSTKLTPTTSSEKVHLKKPETADGSFLEQSHITKPAQKPTPAIIIDSSLISKSESLRDCLMKLPRECTLKIEKCQTKSNTALKDQVTTSKETKILAMTTTIKAKTLPFFLSDDNICEFEFVPMREARLTANSAECSNIMQGQLKILNISVDSIQNCFNVTEKKLSELLEIGKNDQFKCFIRSNDHENNQCQATHSCKYIDDSSDVGVASDEQKVSSQATECFSKEYQRLRDLTSTTTTTASPTLSTTRSSSSIDETIISANIETSNQITSITSTPSDLQIQSSSDTTAHESKLPDSSQYFTIANQLFNSGQAKLESLIEKSNDLQRVYLILSFAYLVLALLHSCILFAFVKQLVLSCINGSLYMTRLLLCCCRKSGQKSNIEYHRANSGTCPSDNNIPLLSLQSPFGDSTHCTTSVTIETSNAGTITCQQAMRSIGFWFILAAYFFYGGLLLNFIIFMKIHLTSQLDFDSVSEEPEHVFKLFLITFMLTRCILLIFNAISKRVCCKSKGLAASSSRSQLHKPSSLISTFIKQNVKIYLVLAVLIVISILQLPKPVKIMLNDEIKNVPRLNRETVLVYGYIYPFLISTLTPQFFDLFEKYLKQQECSNDIDSYVTLYLWQIGSLGAILITLFTNYSIYNIFKSADVFIFSNLIQTSGMLVFLVMFGLIANRKVTKPRRFISFNDLRLNETEKSMNASKRMRSDMTMNDYLNDENDSEDEEIVLMIDNRERNSLKRRDIGD